MPIAPSPGALPTIIETPVFTKQIDALLSSEERGQLMAMLADDPLAGDVIKETGGVRKLRFAKSGTGKSGGIRVIYWFLNASAPLYALLAYGKSGQENLTPDQTKAVSKLTEALKRLHTKGRPS